MEHLIHKLSQYNINVGVVGNQLKLNIPEGVDAGDIIQEVRQKKEELIAFIRKVKSNQVSAQREFWRNEFKDVAAGLEWPLDFTRPCLISSRREHWDFESDEEQTRAMRRLADSEGVSMFVLILAVCNVLSGKLGNREDIVTGTPGKANLLMLRNYPDGRTSFSEFLRDVKRRSLACFENQGCGLEDLTGDLKAPVLFVYGDAPVNEDSRAAFDLVLYASDRGDRILFRFEYPPELFKKQTIERFAGYFSTILSVVSANEDIRISGIQMIGKEEYNKLLSAFNNTRHLYPEKESVIGLFEKQVIKSHQKTAIRFEGREISYGDLNYRAGKLSACLIQHHVPAGAVIAILMERGIDCIACILAVLKHGCTYLPICPEQPDSRINYILKDSKAKCLLTKEIIFDARTLSWSGPSLFLDRDKAETGLEGGAGIAASCTQIGAAREWDTVGSPVTGGDDNDNIYILYPLCPEGNPKGVLGSQRGLINRLYWEWENYPFTPEEICCQKTNLNFVDHVVEIFSPLLQGIPSVIFEDRDAMIGKRMAGQLIRNLISRITLLPSELYELIRSIKHKNIRPATFKYVFCSGEELSFNLARKFYKEFGTTRLVNIYGSAETGGGVTYFPVDRFHDEDFLKHFKHVSVLDYLNGGDHPEARDLHAFTSADVGVEQLVKIFTDSRITDYPVSLEAYYERLRKDVIPYAIDTSSPSYIGHMTSVLPDYVHDISKLISRLNQNLVKIETSKSLTFLERQAIAILHRIFYSFPEAFYQEHSQQLNANLGIITSGGSTANMSALLSARNKALFATGNDGTPARDASIYSLMQERGYKDMVLLGSELMHYSFRKAMSVMGLGAGNLVYVKNDDQGRLSVTDLEAKIRTCREEKLLVLAIIGIAGSTERGSIDPLAEIGRVARQNNIHFHVDGAWGGALIFSERNRRLIEGIEYADSITFCGHKQMFLPQGISICLFKDPGQLNYNSVTANYQATANSFDTGRFTIEGSRPALSLCLHASLHVIGKKGYELLIDRNIEKAASFAQMIGKAEGFELIGNGINIINYRYIPIPFRQAWKSEQLTAGMNDRINTVNSEIQERQFYHGRTFVSKTVIKHANHGTIVVFRVVLSNPLTEQDDLVRVLNDQFSIIEDLYNEHNELCKQPENLPLHEMAGDFGRKSDKNDRAGISIGKPLYNIQIAIVDKYNNLQPIGVPGEICVSGGFVPIPYFSNDRVYKTGDCGKWLPDGNIGFLGRMDNRIKWKGFLIEPGADPFCLVRQPPAAPGTGLESALAGIWEELLGAENIGIDDNFFERGGNLWSAIKMAAAVKNKLNIDIPLSSLFRLSTIRLIAKWTGKEGCDNAPPAEEYEEIKL